jgi:hypothetical protein
MLKSLSRDWNLMRVMRFLLGLTFLFEAFNQRSWSIGIAAGALMLMAVFNAGCGSGISCSVPKNNG